MEGQYYDDGEAKGRRGFPEPSSHQLQPPFPTPTIKGQMAYMFFEDVPNGVAMRDKGGGGSTHSVPNFPSPLSERTPSIFSQQPEQQQTHVQHAHSQPHPGRSRTERDENDTFFDDRSLENRIQRTLGQVPRPIDWNTSASVPVTPNGPNRSSNRNAWNTSKRNPGHTLDSLAEAACWNKKSNQEPTPDDKLHSDRSAMKVVTLRRDLRDAQTDLKLTRDQLSQLQQLYNELTEEHHICKERAQMYEEQERVMQKKTEDIKYELISRKSEQEKVVSEKNAMETNMQQLQQETESLRAENQKMSERIGCLLREQRSGIPVGTLNEGRESNLGQPKEELNAALKEIEALKASLEQASKQNVEQEKELEHEKGARKAEVSELVEKHKASEKRVDRLNQALSAVKKEAAQMLKQAMEDAKAEAAQQFTSLETKQQQTKAKHDAGQVEILRLRNLLQEVSILGDIEKNKHNTTDLELKRLKEVNAEQQRRIEGMKETSQIHDKQLNQIKQKMDPTKANNLSHIGGIERLDASLKDPQTLSMPFKHRVVEVPRQKNVSCQTNFTPEPSRALPMLSLAYSGAAGDSIADRLARIRDAAERASLVKDHQREVARLKAQHESKLQALYTQHEQSKEDALASAKLKLDNQHNRALTSIREELEGRIATMAERHRIEISRLKEEIKENSAVSEESMSVAISKLNAGKLKIEQEVAKREQLQQDLTKLEEKVGTEKEKLQAQHEEEVEALKLGWCDEKATLVDMIQRDCNQVFEKQRKSSVAQGREISPRSVGDVGYPKLQQAAPSNSSAAGQSSMLCCLCSVKEPNSGYSPEHNFSNSKIDNELSETEAFVQSLLFGASEG